MTAGWLGRWFGPRGPAIRDRVWLDSAACTAGLQAQVEAALDQGEAALVLLRSAIDLPVFVQALAARHPRVADDAYAAADLQAELARPGALGLSRTDALRTIAAARGGTRRTPLQVQVHVRARDPRRSADARLVDLLAPFAPTTIVFHHALDDDLLREHTRALEPLLRSMKLSPQEAIDSPLLTRAIQRTQRP